MLRVVVSQPMFLPWIGLFEQIRLADLFVHYDDVQMPRGRSFVYRVQIKTPRGQQWLSAQIDKKASGRRINEIRLVDNPNWKNDHLNLLRENYRNAPFYGMMRPLAEELYAFEGGNLALFNQHATETIAGWLGLDTKFVRSSDTGVGGGSSQRLINLCQYYAATHYITGHGALNYLDHNSFEERGIAVEYMDYIKQAYPQLHGEFMPYLSILDAIACTGPGARELLLSDSVYWGDYIDQPR